MRDIFDLIGPDGKRTDIHPPPTKRITLNHTHKFKASVNNGMFRFVAYGHEQELEIWLTHKQAKALSAILAKRTTEVWTTPEGTE